MLLNDITIHSSVTFVEIDLTKISNLRIHDETFWPQGITAREFT